MMSQLRPAFIMLLIFTFVTGLVYPLSVTGIAQLFFPHQANGSLILVNGKVYGSELIGQQFDDPKFFWGRLSATGAFPYTPFKAESMTGSSGSNLGPLNPNLIKMVQARVNALKAVDPENTQLIPVDLVTASGSGLDPHISVAAALYQVHRVAQARGLTDETVKSLVEKQVESRQVGFLGEPRVNVLLLNIALNEIQ